jgi:hypothetical protein
MTIRQTMGTGKCEDDQITKKSPIAQLLEFATVLLLTIIGIGRACNAFTSSFIEKVTR